MADLKASAATVAALTDASLLLASIGGADRVVRGDGIATYMGNKRRNISSPAQAITVATSTKLSGSDISAVGLVVGSAFRWRFTMTKTATGSAARNFFLRVGPLATVSDPAAIQFTSAAGTAVADAALIEIVAIVTGISGTACTLDAYFVLMHNLSATGFALVPVQVMAIPSAQANFDSTAANIVATLSVTGGASEAMTLRQMFAEAFNV